MSRRNPEDLGSGITASMVRAPHALGGMSLLGSAGLVLLYCDAYDRVPPAVVLPEVLVLGREPPAGGFVIPDRAVSRIHGSIEFERGRFVIKDAASRNGILVNNVRKESAELSDNDILRIGDAVFKFVERDAARHAPFRIDGQVFPGLTHARLSGGVGGYQMSALASSLQNIAPTDLPVLIQGETGTGKEIAARTVHDASGRTGALRAINCAAIAPGLFESELFGVKRGAFTGADRNRGGLVRAAQGGTLLLDEIGELPLEAQAKLQPKLVSREIIPVGGDAPEPVDVRVLCATHRDLQAMVRERTFRADLLARISGFAVRLPPLRERKEDLFQLAQHFLAMHGAARPRVGFSLMLPLLHYDWPGNVRELELTVRRAIALAGAGPIEVAHLPDSLRLGVEPQSSPRERMPSMLPPGWAPRPERSHAPPEAQLRDSLLRHKGNVAAVAREYNKDRAQIHRWLRHHHLDAEDFRSGDAE